MPFQKGRAKTGGRKPGQVSRATLTMLDLYAPITETARTSLEMIAKNADHPACVTACKEINDRAYGRPPQSLAVEQSGTIRVIVERGDRI